MWLRVPSQDGRADCRVEEVEACRRHQSQTHKPTTYLRGTCACEYVCL